jgi:predicted ATP-grasp superfamily ATP-dependent carboligase
MTPPADRPVPKPGRVLVTDGEFKHTLGIVRSLAARGHEVHLLARSSRAPAVHSQAVRKWHRAPASTDPAFEARLLEIARAIAPASLIPVGNGAVAAADRLRERLGGGIALALPSHESLSAANDKLGEARAAMAALGLPLVLKSAREEGRKVLRYVRTEAELSAAYDAVRGASAAGVLAQACVAGDGLGFSALYWHGRRVRGFAHRRVREWPPSGGTSACADSIASAPALERAGTLLLDALAWHGVAMVEFKGDLDREPPALIEINAKFWGSLDVALAAGVDFPGDLAALLEGGELGEQAPVRDVRFSWPLGGDLWHGLFRPSSLPRVLWDALSPHVAHSYRIGDPAPLLWEAAQWVRSTPGAWREHKELR